MLPLFSDLTPRQKEAVDVLHSIEQWPMDFGKDAELLRRLEDLYPAVDLYEEAVGFAAWMSEFQSRKEIKHRARFRNWVKKANEFQRNRQNRRYRPPSSEGHGSTVRASEKW